MIWHNQKLSLQKAERIISDTDSAHCFWTHSGVKVRNLYELERALQHMPVSEYLFHATEQKNDFAIWILDVFGDDFLSNKIIGLEHPIQAAGMIRKRIESLERHIDKEHERAHKLEENIFSHSDDWKNVGLVGLCIILFILAIVLGVRLV